MTLAFPHLLLEPVMPKLNTHRYFAPLQRALSQQEGDGLHENVLRVGLTVRGVLVEVPVSIRALLDLQPGDVLPLGVPSSTPATVELEGVARFTGRPGTVNRRRALRLLSVIQKGDMIRDSDHTTGRARVYAP
jgi:flagellar motor switch protein FliM